MSSGQVGTVVKDRLLNGPEGPARAHPTEPGALSRDARRLRPQLACQRRALGSGNWSPGSLDWGGGLGTEDHGIPCGQVKPRSAVALAPAAYWALWADTLPVLRRQLPRFAAEAWSRRARRPHPPRRASVTGSTCCGRLRPPCWKGSRPATNPKGRRRQPRHGLPQGRAKPQVARTAEGDSSAGKHKTEVAAMRTEGRAASGCLEGASLAWRVWVATCAGWPQGTPSARNFSWSGGKAGSPTRTRASAEPSSRIPGGSSPAAFQALV